MARRSDGTTAPVALRRKWGYHDAQLTRTFSRFPMPLLQQTKAAHLRTYDVETAAKWHFDRAYAKGYVEGWLANDK